MSSRPLTTDSEILAAYQTHEAEQRIANTKVGCALVVTLMPLGSTADLFVYPEMVKPFLIERLICSGLAGLIWMALFTPQGKLSGKWLGRIVPLLPTIFLAGMIAVTDGFASSYYAALNLVLLAVGAVLQWTIWESIVAVLLVLAMYVAAGSYNGTMPGQDVLFSNFYFIGLMDIIVVVGTYFQSQARFREFALRFELDRNRKLLEEQKQSLETALKQLKEAEAELVQQEKLASLGRMSAGMIHEINNPINYIKTGLYTLRNKGRHLPPEQQEVYAETVKDVEEGIDRVRKIVSDLRSFTHHDDDMREDISLTDLVESSLKFVSHEWQDTVQLQKKLDSNLFIQANKNKLIQVCVNLLENSLDALKQKTFADGETPAITVETRKQGNTNLLVIRDNGPGIKPEHLSKIFDPFFTTKDVGEGMGLGLSISYRIVAEAQGRIRVNTEPGCFCEFTLEFPSKE